MDNPESTKRPGSPPKSHFLLEPWATHNPSKNFHLSSKSLHNCSSYLAHDRTESSAVIQSHTFRDIQRQRQTDKQRDRQTDNPYHHYQDYGRNLFPFRPQHYYIIQAVAYVNPVKTNPVCRVFHESTITSIRWLVGNILTEIPSPFVLSLHNYRQLHHRHRQPNQMRSAGSIRNLLPVPVTGYQTKSVEELR